MKRKSAVHRVVWGVGVWAQIVIIVGLVVAAIVLTPEPSEKMEQMPKEYKDG